jgi:hypothetical protein
MWREKIDHITFILDNQHYVPGRRFHGGSLLSPKLFRFASLRSKLALHHSLD